MLHDIGRLGLLVAYPDTYNEILCEADRDSVSLLELEKRRFGMDHCEIGRILTGEWRLPQEFLVATGRHHDPPQGGPFDLLVIVHLSCGLADALGYCAVAPLYPISFERFQEMVPAPVKGRVPETAEAFAAFVKEAIGEDQGDLDSCAARPFLGAAPHLPEPDEEYAASIVAPQFDSPDDMAWDFGIVLLTVAIFAFMILVLVVLRNT